MIKQHNGAFLVNDTAANDPICQQVMASYMDELRRETARRERIRQGLEPARRTVGQLVHQRPPLSGAACRLTTSTQHTT